jgi:N-acetylglutamate synthase-like GNAT family acetyltransferase
MIVIKRTGPSDKDVVQKVYDFYLEMRKTNPLIEKSYNEIESNVLNGFSFIALIDDKIVGFVTCRNWPDFVELMTLIVEPEMRCQGIGGKLSKYLFRYLRDKFSQKTIVVFPNDKSMGIMTRNGLVQKTRKDIPEFLYNVYRAQLSDPKYDSVLFAMEEK